MSNPDPDWLDSLRRDLEAITKETSEQLWPSPADGAPAWFNYRVEHVRQVQRDALALLEGVGGDRDVVLASVWLHDRFQPAFNVPGHGEMAAQWAEEHLADRGFPAEKVDAVSHAVAHHYAPAGSLPADAHEARLLWDADKLAHVGPVEMLTVVFNNMAADCLHGLADDPAFPERRLAIRDLTQTKLDRFRVGQFRADRFYFPLSRQWVAERYQAVRNFCQTLAEQVGIT